MSDSTDSHLPVIPYGAWPSPISAADLVQAVVRPSDAWPGRTGTWWLQSRPDQGGREQLVFRAADGTVSDPLGSDWSARTRVHEYGGGAWWVADEVVFAVNWSDQRLYRADPGTSPVPLTPQPPAPGAWRYADGRLTADGSYVICVRESHTDGEVRNEIVAFPARVTGNQPVTARVLVEGCDFVASPRVSPDGRYLAWIEWQHPNMPWDSTSLWIADLVDDDGPALADIRLLAGVGRTGGARTDRRDGQSLMQPVFGPDGRLYVISDITQWWNVHQVDETTGRLNPVLPLRSEIGGPAWTFGNSDYVVASNGEVWLSRSDDHGAHLVRVEPGEAPQTISLPFRTISRLRSAPDGDRVTAIATRDSAEPSVVEFTLDSDGRLSWVDLHEVNDHGLDPAGISAPEHVTFPSVGGRNAHALFYAPRSTLARGPQGSRPPLVVTVHGGPTAAARGDFRLGTQFWTSRGFAVIDVDYAGSTGYGRAYRQLLENSWGIVDVEDACAAALWVTGEGLVDPDQLAIRGPSAGGFTVLACLATRDVFKAGASLYGVADLGALAKDTHKFESRYLDRLVGPWPQARDIYRERSPLSHVDGFDRPLIVLQGTEDAVVPPAQAEMIVAALASRKVPHSYLLFPGEQHGFRRSENIIRAFEAELSFYGSVFGFDPPGITDPVEIRFGEQLGRRNR